MPKRAPIAKIDGLTPSMTRPFFARSSGARFDARVSDVITIDIFDEIGRWGVTEEQVAAQLGANKPIQIRLNSPGGDVFAGIAIYNLLVAHPETVTITVVGYAASAASLVAMSADNLIMSDGSFLMVHNAWTDVYGNRHDFSAAAGVLGKIDIAMAATYAARSGQDADAVAAMMDAETWLTAREAVDAGFADSVGPEVAARAAFDLSAYAHTPASLRGSLQPASGVAALEQLTDTIRSLT